MEYRPPVEPPVTRSTDIGIIIGGIVGGLLLLIILVLILWKVSYNFLIRLNSSWFPAYGIAVARADSHSW